MKPGKKPPNKGFGLAISGGLDRPYYGDGNPSIVVSDVLPGGPAEGKLKVGDRVISVNGQYMDRVRHEVALNSLRKSGDRVVLAISRERIMPPPPLKQKILTVTDSVPAPPEQHEIEIYKDPSEGYGMRLGWKLYVQGVNEQGVAALAGVKVGDKIDRINDKSAETLSLVDVRREIELSKEVMSLEITREPQDESDSIRNNGRFVPVLPVAGGYPNGEHITATTVSTVESALPRPPVIGNDAPQRPPSPPPSDFVNGEPVNDPEGEEREISYRKGKSVGLRLVGGNEVGIYVAAITWVSGRDCWSSRRRQN
ncbi:putative tight junction protein ZO-1 isoform X2 [Apostichopus japonicus]|uniref:Putative tight junction protein ZO-1 isoform X2 n=1 Tax=Stichopus japonicus TaxID=307972 RepID=A0A2G8LB29_STIJA|nr:putative tight junction protein ZO-1 isoform X2 [Apostichopus japonicus]